MYFHNFDPVLFRLGFLEIRYYGLVYLLGFLLVFLFLRKYKKELSLKEDDVYNLIFYLFIGVILGARIFHFIFSEPYILINDPLEFFRIWNGGMSFFGSLTGVILMVYIFCKRYKTSFFKTADVLVLPATIALFFGRIANFINAELIGRITDVSWCVIFPTYSQCRHPYQIYAALSHLVLLIILIFTWKLKEKRKLKNGVVFVSFVVFYSLLRITTDFFREDLRIFGFTIWQYISLAFLLLGIYIYKKLKN
ncbi:MAG: prolipoprotein diacylglyceryl transferase [Nanoarchaeota archaeon]